MLSCTFINAKLLAKKDIPDLLIEGGKYRPKYEPPYELIGEKDFLNLFEQYRNKTKINLDEHEICNMLTDTAPMWEIPYSLRNYGLFIHWYERRYKKNIINKNLLINLFNYTEFWKGQNNKIAKVYSPEECKRLIFENIMSLTQSKKFEGYSLFYENFFSIFPDIESLSYDDFKGSKLISYLIDLFPSIRGISTNKLHYIRYSFEASNEWEYEGGIHYFGKYQTPSFWPVTKFSVSKDIFAYRSIENLLRSNKGLPKIGEGWISETTLFYSIKQRINQYEVIQHGSPTWLGRQHLDIWIPELKIGIEYQGAQHDKPVEFFGGQKAFDENLKRDARKRQLCKENGVKLIEVREGYSIEDIMLIINNAT